MILCEQALEDLLFLSTPCGLNDLAFPMHKTGMDKIQVFSFWEWNKNRFS